MAIPHSEFRRFAGDNRLTARMTPMEWFAIAKRAGLSDQWRGEAITDLLKNEFIAFQPETTEIIAFSPEGIEMADQLVRERPKLEGPIPRTLDAVRSETLKLPTGRKISLPATPNQIGGIG